MSKDPLKISGKRKYIDSLQKEIENEGFEFDSIAHMSKISSLWLWYIHKSIDRFTHIKESKLKAHLPSHRKHFKREVRKTLEPKNKQIK